MKNWKKFVVLTSLSLALGFVGGHITYPQLQPVIKKVFTKQGAVNYSEFIEKYKSLSLEGLASEDFACTHIESGDESKGVSEITDMFQALKENLSVDFIENNIIKDDVIDRNKSFYELSITNRKNIRFDAVYNFSNKEPSSITIYEYNPKHKEWEPFTKRKIILKKDLKVSNRFHINYYYDGDKTEHIEFKTYTAGFTEEGKKIKEFFDIASQKFKTVKSMVIYR